MTDPDPGAPRGARKGLFIVAGLVAAVMVTLVATWMVIGGSLGTDRDAVPAEAPTPTGSTPAPAPTPTLTTTAPPTPAPAHTSVSADPDEWIISDSGIGPLRVGMPFDEAIALVPGAAPCRPDADPAYLSDDHRLWIMRPSSGTSAELGTVAWDTSLETGDGDGPRTTEGIGIGSSPAEVRAVYPEAILVTKNTEALQVGRMYFAFQNDVVVSLGVTTDEVPWEYCG